MRDCISYDEPEYCDVDNFRLRAKTSGGNMGHEGLGRRDGIR
jgi:hypothetical protein